MADPSVRKIAKSNDDITCYIRYWGPWGMYHPEDGCISICPVDLDRLSGGLSELVKHEIEHLKNPEANKLPHETKEKYINRIQNTK